MALTTIPPSMVNGAFADRATAAAAYIPAAANKIAYLSDIGYVTEFREKLAGETATAALTTNGGSREWLPAKEVTPLHFGAAFDGSTDDLTAWNATIAYIDGLSPAGFPEIFCPAGISRIMGKIALSTQFLKIRGAGMGRATGSTSDIDGGFALLYDGSALSASEGVIDLDDGSTANRGVEISDLSILCQQNGIGIYAVGADMMVIERVYIDQPTTGIYADTCYSSRIADCEIFDPTTGGIDLVENCHCCIISNNRFNNLYPGGVVTTETPSFGLRVASVGNSSAILVENNNFDYYRVARHLDWASDCKGGAIIGNYVECRGDGVTGAALYIQGGSGFIAGNRFSKSNSPTPTLIDYGINFISTAHDWTVTGCYFSGFDTAAIRIANGATNINSFGHELVGGLAHYVNQNAAGSKNSTVMQSGDIVTDSVTTDSVTTETLTIGGEASDSGTFTANLIGAGTTGTNSYTDQTVAYEKIGGVVFLWGRIRLDGTPGALDSTGALSIDLSNLSYTIGTIGGGSIGRFAGLNLAADYSPGISLTSFAGGNTIELLQMRNTNSGAITDAQAGDSLDIQFSANFQVA